MVASTTHLFPESAHLMGFDIDDGGLHVVLSRDVPSFLRGRVRPLVESLCASQGVPLSSLRFAAIHPGGRRILEDLESELELPRALTQHSWDVLGEHGNMSSATVLFVLDRLLAGTAPPTAATACWRPSDPASPPSSACCAGARHEAMARSAWCPRRRASPVAAGGLRGAAAARAGGLQAHERALRAAGQPRARERGFGWMVAAHLAPFVLTPIEARRRRRPAPRAVVAGSLAALGAAGALRFWTLHTLGDSWSVRVHGGPSMRVVSGGPYRFVRHPNYLAVIVEVAALPLVGGAVGTALVASLLDAVALALRISDEERVLRTSSAWRQVMAHKPRLLPRLRPAARPRA